MKFDLDAIDTKTLSDEGVEMVVKAFQTNEPLIARNGKPVTIILHGPDSDKYREFTRSQLKKRINNLGDSKRITDYNVEEAEADSLELLSRVTSGWLNVFDTEGNEIPYSSDVAKTLYTNYPLVREQVDAFVANRANFLKKPLVL